MLPGTQHSWNPSSRRNLKRMSHANEALLRITLIDVGFGDSIFVEMHPTGEASEDSCYALIDSNDSAQLRRTHVFLNKELPRSGITPSKRKRPFFDWILMTHLHQDHGGGLKKLMSDYGTKQFFHSQLRQAHPTWAGSLIKYLKLSHARGRLAEYTSVTRGDELPSMGCADFDVIWPKAGYYNAHNENNNSIVVSVNFGNCHLLLTGDAECEVWEKIRTHDTHPLDVANVFKVPHHGSCNGTFHSDKNGNRSESEPCWIENLETGNQPVTMISTQGFQKYLNKCVVDLIEQRLGEAPLRTDVNRDIVLECHLDGTIIPYFHSARQASSP